MSKALPIEAEQYVISGDVTESVANLNAAIERGEFGIDVLMHFLSAVQKGSDPRFSKTKPVPLLMREMIEANRDRPPAQVVYKGYEDGLWTWEDVENYENNAAALRQARHEPRKGVYLTRNRRTRKSVIRTEGMFVPKMSLGAVCNQNICDGAKACLALILSKAGKSNTLVTYTVSLATQLGRTTRTIRNYFIQLEEAGLIRREAGVHPNTVKITVCEVCKPTAYKEPADVVAFRLARKSNNPVIRNMAETVVLASFNANRQHFEHLDRRKEISAFNPESNLYGTSSGHLITNITKKSPLTTYSTSYAIPKRSKFDHINVRAMPRYALSPTG